jgi:prepilin-type N-terminal cleavage/methylation domain-containing protein
MDPAHSKHKNSASSQHESGFTLVEILVAMAVLALVSALIINLFARLGRSFLTEKIVAETQQDLRHTMERICLDIRNGGLDPKRSASAGIEVGTATAFRFTQDTYDATLNDYNGTIDNANEERITYWIDGGNRRLVKILYQGTASETSRMILDDIDPANSGFTYLNDAGAATAKVKDIRSVIINLALQNSAGWGGGVNRTLRAQVKLRNIGLN